MEWFKNLIEQYYKKGGQSLVNLSIILIIGVIIMIAGSNLLGIGSGKETKSTPAKTEDIQPVNKKQSDYNEYADELENRLEEILSSIQGVGKVSVMITFDSGTEIVPAEDYKNNETITEEEDTQGGKRKLTQTEKDKKVLVLSEQGGKQEPLIIKKLYPKVKGVVVVAEGASDVSVKADIFNSVKTVLGVPPHKVQVFQLKK